MRNTIQQAEVSWNENPSNLLNSSYQENNNEIKYIFISLIQRSVQFVAPKWFFHTCLNAPSFATVQQ